MYEARTLIDHYWVDRDEDKELFNKTRRDLARCHRFFSEQLGWRVIQNGRIIKAEKIPAMAEPFMGITGFMEKSDYIFLCSLLIFLDDKEENGQFLLSEMIGVLEEIASKVMTIDWSQFSLRKSLVRMLQYAEEKRFLVSYEGKSESLANGMGQEILYENTGLSRYFVTNFGFDTKKFRTYADFENNVPDEADADRGHFRINRVYRRLVAAPAVYWQDANDADALYIKNQRQWIEKNLQDQLGGQLHVHRGSAYYVLADDGLFGVVHPQARIPMASQLILLFCGIVMDEVAAGNLACESDTTIHISQDHFSELVDRCKDRYGDGWSQEYRDMAPARLHAAVEEALAGWLMLTRDGNKITLYPAVGKLRGAYPGDFDKTGDEEDRGDESPQLSLF